MNILKRVLNKLCGTKEAPAVPASRSRGELEVALLPESYSATAVSITETGQNSWRKFVAPILGFSLVKGVMFLGLSTSLISDYCEGTGIPLSTFYYLIDACMAASLTYVVGNAIGANIQRYRNEQNQRPQPSARLEASDGGLSTAESLSAGVGMVLKNNSSLNAKIGASIGSGVGAGLAFLATFRAHLPNLLKPREMTRFRRVLSALGILWDGTALSTNSIVGLTKFIAAATGNALDATGIRIATLSTAAINIALLLPVAIATITSDRPLPHPAIRVLLDIQYGVATTALVAAQTLQAGLILYTRIADSSDLPTLVPTIILAVAAGGLGLTMGIIAAKNADTIASNRQEAIALATAIANQGGPLARLAVSTAADVNSGIVMAELDGERLDM